MSQTQTSTSNSGQFVVVDFPEEEENDSTPMDIIASSWTFNKNQKKYCFWPSYIKTNKEKIEAMKNGTPLNINKCSICEIRVKYIAKTYEKALEKLEMLQNETSVTQTSDDESDNDLQIDTHPKKRPLVRPRQYEDYVLSQSNSQQTSDEEAYPTPPKLVKFQKSIQKPTSSPVSGNSLKHSEIVEYNVPTPSSSRSSTPISNCNNCFKNEILLKTLMTKVETLVSQQKYLIQMAQQSSNIDITAGDSATLAGLPAKNEEELDKLETTLKDDTAMANLISTLQVIGGKDVVDTTRRIISRIVSNPLAVKINWSGRNDKIGFLQYKNILKLITVAVRNNPFCRQATQQEIESVIKVWLRNAGDRDGGRSRRQKLQNDNNHNDV